MAKKGKPADIDGLDANASSPPADAYVTLMLISVAALAAGIALLAMTLSDYGWAVNVGQ